jgi:hypothetical protein
VVRPLRADAWRTRFGTSEAQSTFSKHSHSTTRVGEANSRTRHLASGNEKSRLNRFDFAFDVARISRVGVIGVGQVPRVHAAPIAARTRVRVMSGVAAVPEEKRECQRSLLELMLAMVSDRPSVVADRRRPGDRFRRGTAIRRPRVSGGHRPEAAFRAAAKTCRKRTSEPLSRWPVDNRRDDGSKARRT